MVRREEFLTTKYTKHTKKDRNPETSLPRGTLISKLLPPAGPKDAYPAAWHAPSR